MLRIFIDHALASRPAPFHTMDGRGLGFPTSALDSWELCTQVFWYDGPDGTYSHTTTSCVPTNGFTKSWMPVREDLIKEVFEAVWEESVMRQSAATGDTWVEEQKMETALEAHGEALREVSSSQQG